MTRKDFELIASAVKKAYEGNQERGRQGEAEGAFDAAVSLADALATSNPLFDRERFLRACGRAW